MKPKDITEYDHPLAWYTWRKDEAEYINARVNLAYEEGRKDALALPEKTPAGYIYEVFSESEAKPKARWARSINFHLPHCGEPVRNVRRLFAAPLREPEQSEPHDLVLHNKIDAGLKRLEAPPLRELSVGDIGVLAEKHCLVLNTKLVSFTVAVLAAARSKT